MIARLEGVLRDVEPTRVVIDVAGVGYEVNIPLSTFSALPDVGKTTALRIHTHAREGSIQLFGFLTEPERVAFALLLRANRVGPRLAQTLLSGVSPAELLEAIETKNVAVLRAAPGIGSKMAERILLELSDRTGELKGSLVDAGGPHAPVGPSMTMLEQALSALLNLGYSKNQAERALAGAMEETDDDATLEMLVRTTLRMLVK